MTDNRTEQQKIISKAWKKFALLAIKLNKDIEPEGRVWFYGLHFLLEKDAKKTRESLPKGHPLKTISRIPKKIREKLDTDIKDRLEPAIDNLKLLLGDVKKVKEIDFSEIIFDECTDFSNFIFPIDTKFNNAEFVTDVFFNNAVFFETADFEDAIFQNKKSYRKETAKFRNTTFSKIANFRKATFWGYANFKGAKLKGRAFFQEAIFKCHAPRFYDATFNNEITWAGIALPDFKNALVDYYKKIGNKFELITCTECTNYAGCTKYVKHNICDKHDICDICFKHAKCDKCEELIEQNRRRRIEENQNSYENTAILLEGTKKYHDQHFFFQYEMGCRRELENNYLICFMFWLYETLASYGYGIGRAFTAWFLHMFFGAIIIFIIASCAGLGIWQALFCSASTSFANANPFVFIGIKDGSLMACYTKLQIFSLVGFGYVRGIQIIIGIPLLFLLLTTLRVRFRLK